MVKVPREPAARIAYLEAKVEALEAALERRSRELRRLQQGLEPESLLQASRLLSGLPPLPRQAYDPELWPETTRLTGIDVEPVMRDLWRSLTPPDDDLAHLAAAHGARTVVVHGGRRVVLRTLLAPWHQPAPSTFSYWSGFGAARVVRNLTRTEEVGALIRRPWGGCGA